VAGVAHGSHIVSAWAPMSGIIYFIAHISENILASLKLLRNAICRLEHV
jgi:hypothetical protein